MTNWNEIINYMLKSYDFWEGKTSGKPEITQEIMEFDKIVRITVKSRFK